MFGARIVSGPCLPLSQGRETRSNSELTLCGWLSGATGTAKTRTGRTGLSARGAEEAGGGRLRGLCRNCDCRLRIRGKSPNQCDDPPYESPSREDVQNKDGGEVGLVPRQKRRQKVQEKRHQPEDGVEMKERDEFKSRDQHAARSAMNVFYHEFVRFASGEAILAPGPMRQGRSLVVASLL